MEDGGTTSISAWTSLPLDLLLEIFRRLESTALTRCAGACKPWRRAIIGNTRLLRPRLDRFVPGLLLGVFHRYGDDDDGDHEQVFLRRTSGPFQSALPLTSAADRGSKIQSLIPATAAGIDDREIYTELLSSRDGFVLLRGRPCCGGRLRLCLLCNTNTNTEGYCKIIPDCTIRSCTYSYVLLTGYDDDHLSAGTGNTGNDDLPAVRILAVAAGTTNSMCTKDNRITYQVFSFTSGGGGGGSWGPSQRSEQLMKGADIDFNVHLYDDTWRAVVSGDNAAVYWLGGFGDGDRTTFAVALDVRTGRAWTTELAEEIQLKGPNILTPTLLATSGDGRRLSLVRSPPPDTTGHQQQIQVWVLMGGDDDGQWSLQRTIDLQVHKMLPDYRHDSLKDTSVLLHAFCPRSGCVIADFAGQEICVDLQGTCVQLITTREGYYWNDDKMWVLKTGALYCTNACPYEMDWSTYVSRMKQF